MLYKKTDIHMLYICYTYVIHMLYIYGVHEKGPVKMDFQQANLLLVLYSVHQKKTHMSYICYTYMVCMKKEKGPVEIDFQQANLLLVLCVH